MAKINESVLFSGCEGRRREGSHGTGQETSHTGSVSEVRRHNVYSFKIWYCNFSSSNQSVESGKKILLLLFTQLLLNVLFFTADHWLLIAEKETSWWWAAAAVKCLFTFLSALLFEATPATSRSTWKLKSTSAKLAWKESRYRAGILGRPHMSVPSGPKTPVLRFLSAASRESACDPRAADWRRAADRRRHHVLHPQACEWSERACHHRPLAVIWGQHVFTFLYSCLRRRSWTSTGRGWRTC